MNIAGTFFIRYRQALLYGASLSLLLFLLKWLQWKYLIADNALEIYIGGIALIFTLLGVWIAGQLTRPKVHTIIVEKEVPAPPFILNEAEFAKLNLTEREWDVLQLMAKGMSNAEIAADLFLSVSTIKTHVSNVLLKMDVTSRVKAVEKAKRLRITP